MASLAMKAIHLMFVGKYDDEEDHADNRRLSRLSITTCDGHEADAEMSDEEQDDDDDAEFAPVSLPGTPDWSAAGSGSGSGSRTEELLYSKDGYASEMEAAQERGRRKKGWGRRVRVRERRLEHAWEMKKREQFRVLVSWPRVGAGAGQDSICMDMDEVKACRDLGIELPCDWIVDTSSGGNSPIASPGDDPREVKERLKIWAQAVALASASSLSG